MNNRHQTSPFLPLWCVLFLLLGSCSSSNDKKQPADTAQPDTTTSNCNCKTHDDCSQGFCKGGTCQLPLKNDECWVDDGVCSEGGSTCVGVNICACDTPCALGTQPGTCVYKAPGWETTLRLTNDSDAPIYVQTSNNKGIPTWHEVYLEAESPLQIHDNCAVKNCDNLLDTGSCANIAPTTQKLAPGESIKWVWPGGHWGTAVGPNGTCEYGGSGYTSGSAVDTRTRFCWGDTQEKNLVTKPTCINVPFIDGADADVSHSVK